MFIKAYVEGLIDGIATTPKMQKSYLETIKAKAENIDPVQFRNILTNILENSVKYKNIDCGLAEIACFEEREDVCITLTDDGPGVPEDSLDKIFDIFSCNDPSRNNTSRGSGLGLAITDKVIERLDGHIFTISNNRIKNMEVSKMENKIVVDSCVDFNEEVFTPNIEMERVPFKINIDDEEIEDKNLDTCSLLSKMKANTGRILTACPSPNDFLTTYKKCKNIFVVTISSKLSGSYNSALIAKDMIQEDEFANNFVHVFDSKSASAGESLVALKVKQLLEENLPISQVIEITNHYISSLKTFFILESLDNLMKNGRISHIKGIIGSLLNIVPIMGNDGDGGIELKVQVRGEKKALNKLIEMIGENNINFTNTILSITYVTAMEKAQAIKEEIQRIYNFKDVLIFKAGGLSTIYADDGGIVIAY